MFRTRSSIFFFFWWDDSSSSISHTCAKTLTVFITDTRSSGVYTNPLYVTAFLVRRRVVSNIADTSREWIKLTRKRHSSKQCRFRCYLVLILRRSLKCKHSGSFHVYHASAACLHITCMIWTLYNHIRGVQKRKRGCLCKNWEFKKWTKKFSVTSFLFAF